MNNFNNFSSLSSRRQFFKFAAIASTSAIFSVALQGKKIPGAIGLRPRSAIALSGTPKAIAKSSSLQTASNNSTVRMGVVGLSFYRVVGGVVQNVLESLGHQVEIMEGPHAEIFPVLGQEDLDMLVAVWLPTGHGPLFEEYGTQATALDPLYEDAQFFWGIPNYLPDDIQSIADLTRPEVGAQMNQVIQGIGPGAGITRLSQEIMSRYNLEDAGYSFRTGTEQEWVGAFEQEVEEDNGVIIPLWQPQYLNQAYEIRRLDDPLGVFPSPDRCSLVVTQNFRDRFPSNTLETLNRIALGVDAVTEMDYLTNVEGLSPREAASRWMEQNQALVQSWLSPSS
ncbi:MAG: glycine betaine ABC transporter substrate-binding protein [Pleurocapsa sp. MO_192.B19]|nr:glycine betaine ABC transporter substrate-binding protein [Pleurocapsa sp. MO_192.B19]